MAATAADEPLHGPQLIALFGFGSEAARFAVGCSNNSAAPRA